MTRHNRSRPPADEPELPPLEVRPRESGRESGDQVRAAVYARTSSRRQHTVPVQLELCRKRCLDRGWRVSYAIKDEGLSGASAERPGFQRLLDLASDAKIDVVVVWKIDRLARSLAHATSIEEIFRENGVAIHSCTEPIDTTTATGRFMFGTLANAAQLEREIIGERSRMSLQDLAQRGRWARPRIPFGYRRSKGKNIRIHDGEAAVVRAVFEAYLAGQSLNEASFALNRDGFTFRGKPWTQERVRMIIDNRICVGEFNVSGVQKHLPKLAIVPRELAESVWTLRSESPRSGKAATPDARELAIDSVFRQYLASLE
ncbi:MAG: recombinase family protein [bacterium]